MLTQNVKMDDECNGEWVLKNSCFVKTAEIWGIVNVHQIGDCRL